ncbi:TPA: hypothetical protein ABRA27_002490 [Escherichia coli]
MIIKTLKMSARKRNS